MRQPSGSRSALCLRSFSKASLFFSFSLSVVSTLERVFTAKSEGESEGEGESKSKSESESESESESK